MQLHMLEFHPLVLVRAVTNPEYLQTNQSIRPASTWAFLIFIDPRANFSDASW